MRRINVHRFDEGTAFCGRGSGVEISLSDWRKIRRVLRAAENHRRRIMFTSSPVERELLDAIDALNKQPKK